jgi:hypothetical protein
LFQFPHLQELFGVEFVFASQVRLPSQEWRRLWKVMAPLHDSSTLHPSQPPFQFEKILRAVALSQVRARVALMLAGVQQHPNLPRRGPGKNSQLLSNLEWVAWRVKCGLQPGEANT